MNNKFTLINDDCIEVYKGKNYDNNKLRKNKKVMVFDLDETLGSFIELNLLYNTIENVLQKNDCVHFDELLDMYPEFLRNNIIKILRFIYKQKKKRNLDKLYLYTNNQSRGEFVERIVAYFTKKITNNNEALFDQIIYAFKINDQIIQIGRTSHEKSFKDFIRCTLLPKNTSVCFIDDFNFDEMKKEQIYYIQPKPYTHGLSSKQIVDRLFAFKFKDCMKCNINKINDLFLAKCIHSKVYSLYSARNNAFEDMQNNISKKIMYYVKDYFFIINKNEKSKKKKKSLVISHVKIKININLFFVNIHMP